MFATLIFFSDNPKSILKIIQAFRRSHHNANFLVRLQKYVITTALYITLFPPHVFFSSDWAFKTNVCACVCVDSLSEIRDGKKAHIDKAEN